MYQSQIKDGVIKLTPYLYHNVMVTGGNTEIRFVDKSNKHPDPCKLLLWGYGVDRDGNIGLLPGDYIRYFEKCGNTFTIPYKYKDTNLADIKVQRFKVIQQFIYNLIQSGEINKYLQVGKHERRNRTDWGDLKAQFDKKNQKKMEMCGYCGKVTPHRNVSQSDAPTWVCNICGSTAMYDVNGLLDLPITKRKKTSTNKKRKATTATKKARK